MRLERRVLEREVFMQYFEKQGNALIFRQDGETVRVEPWQKDSLRVRGTLLSEIEEGSIALLDGCFHPILGWRERKLSWWMNGKRRSKTVKSRRFSSFSRGDRSFGLRS